MKRILHTLVFCFAAGMLLQAQMNEGIPAFPGAEGGGKFSTGGRGGDVYHVINLNDTGEGSLREGINSMTGPRTIVFDVAGTIALNSNIYITDKSGLTIAGQTAPGKGITIKNYALRFSGCDHIILRYLRCRYGDENKVSGVGDPDAINFGSNCTNVILDHVSLSWGIDGNGDFNDNGFFTIQWCIFSEGLDESLHDKGGHCMCTSFRRSTGESTMHHNIYGTSRTRHPTTEGGTSPFEFINNLNYNWRGEHNISGTQYNLLNNYYRSGPETDADAYPLRYKNDWGRPPSHAFFEGNYFDIPGEKGSMYTNDTYTALDYEVGSTRASSSYQRTTREIFEAFEKFDAGKYKYAEKNIESAHEAYESCLQYSGCYSPNSIERDNVDVRFLKTIADRTGTLINSQNDLGGWDTYEPLYRLENWDTDGDGMPDDWEIANGLYPNDPIDGNADMNKDGYTNLEDYLSSLAYTHFDTEPVINKVSPANNQVFITSSTSSIEVEVYANDFDGEIAKIELYLDEALVGEYNDSAEIITTLEDVSPGMHSILIKVTDNGENVVSDIRTVYVGTKEVKVTIEDASNGQVSLKPSGGLYTEGVDVNITAFPDEGFLFHGWIKDVHASGNPLIINTVEDITLKPVFVPDSEKKSIYSYPIKINFQSSNGSGPEGFIEDYGLKFNNNSDDYTFGWIEGDNYSAGTNGTAGIWESHRYFEYAGKTYSWGIELPRGIYRIRLGLGGKVGLYPMRKETELRINVEGILVEDNDGVDLLDEHILDSISVLDGQLTLTSVEQSRVCFIEIELLELAFPRMLTVENGQGGGAYFPDLEEDIMVIADTPPEGMEFDMWTGDTAYLEDVHSSITFVSVPDTNVTISATYKNAPQDSAYYLIVANGDGSGFYSVGTDVEVSALDTLGGGSFSHWEYDCMKPVSFDGGSNRFTVSMPDAHIVFEPVYEIPSSGEGDIYQAEEASWDEGSTAERYHNGYFGTGYVNFKEDRGSYVQFNSIDGKEAGSFTIKVRYSLNDKAREGVVKVNEVWDTMVMTQTGSWSDWNELEVRGTLEPGSNNTIRIETIGDDLGYLDQIEVLKLNTTRVETYRPASTLNVKCYPNPFMEFASISFGLEESSEVSIQLHDLQGQRVGVTHRGLFPAGINELKLHRNSLKPGLYILRIMSSYSERNIRIIIN